MWRYIYVTDGVPSRGVTEGVGEGGAEPAVAGEGGGDPAESGGEGGAGENITIDTLRRLAAHLPLTELTLLDCSSARWRT